MEGASVLTPCLEKNCQKRSHGGASGFFSSSTIRVFYTFEVLFCCETPGHPYFSRAVKSHPGSYSRLVR